MLAMSVCECVLERPGSWTHTWAAGAFPRYSATLEILMHMKLLREFLTPCVTCRSHVSWRYQEEEPEVIRFPCSKAFLCPSQCSTRHLHVTALRYSCGLARGTRCLSHGPLPPIRSPPLLIGGEAPLARTSTRSVARRGRQSESHGARWLALGTARQTAGMERRRDEHILPLLTTGHDEEAIVDLGKTSSTIHTNFEEDELQSHRAVYVGVHVPLGREGRHRRRHRGHKHSRTKKERDAPREDGRESPTYDTPSQRVQFILGTEDEDEEHIPHDLFTELDELSFRDGPTGEWKETARWLKFEEDVEDGGERWSKPYVATLSLHSLFELRSCILNGTVLLDMRANSIEEIADMVIDSMVASAQLDEVLREKVREAMLKRHHHQSEKKLSNRIPLVRSIADIGKKHSEPHLLERNGEHCSDARHTLLLQSFSWVGGAFYKPSGGEGLSSSRLSLLKPGISTSSLSRRESLASILLSHLLPSPSPSVSATPQNTPPSPRRSPAPLHRPTPQLVVSNYEREGIPEVVVFPPEEDELTPPTPPGGEEAGPVGPAMSCLLTPEGKYPCRLPVGDTCPVVPASSAPGNLDSSRASENRVSKGGVSRESSTVDFSKVDMNFMRKIPPGAEASNVLVGEVDFLEQPIIAFVRLAPAVLLTGLTEVPVPTRFLFLLLGPQGKGPQYHEIGRSIATLMTDEVSAAAWCWVFGGLVMDVKRKAPFYWSDLRDALSLQCLASVLFLYCACMSPVITFGGLLGEATKGNISAIESLFGASLTGVAFSLFAGQPLTILGSTGPVLVFEKILFKFCKDYGMSYLSLRTSIGLWTAFLCLVLVATDASSLVCYITRFTEEAFAALICIIFIYEALEKLFHLGEMFPVNMHNNLDNLTLYTCVSKTPCWAGGVYCRQCVSAHHQPTLLFKLCSSGTRQVRSTISDFAVFLTIMIMVLVDYLVGIPSPKLHVPDRFEPTSKHRGWFIDPLGRNPWWTMLVAAIPAMLCTILIFMDQQITAVIINRKEHKLKKGCGYHLDLLVVSVMLGVCSVMGLPWFVAATVLSISHVNSLKVESECSAPGEQPKFLGIREQRVTGLLIFVLMGLSVFMTSVLKFIPMPVLYGVFLYMGVSSLKGIQFFDRIKLFGMPAKHQPDLIYLRYVPLWKVHIFTIIQLTCLVLLWVIKASAAAVVFPMMVLALVFIRKLLDFIFTSRELSWLDDLMPESKKKKEDDKKKKEKETVPCGLSAFILEPKHRRDEAVTPYDRSIETIFQFQSLQKAFHKDGQKKAD
ncbi:electroneutral sodium bicarbonate exchanger 1-like [Scleropages formosus]|uniref:Electroneutral sodium bicarbonate exchanger 1-like n=1 Tax=Scleropages formosus TaxID=113540 RepID=A0A0P7YXM0_SCLFO|nr:electroneutral sodium bicarbonate exchanger 1-like [Scleropages formosus]